MIDPQQISRRAMLKRSGTGFGMLALADLTSIGGLADDGRTHFPGKAKRVIHVFLNGGMSQVDTFDPKPELTKRGGQMLPYENLQTERRTGVALPSPFTFKKYGESGIPISEIFPHLSKHADELAVVRSMHAQLPNHEMSLMLMNTGDQRLVRPSFGSWLTWGMGSENQNLPGFIALCPGGMPVGGAGNWRSAFLPGVYQGTHVDTSKADPKRLIENVHNDRLTTAEQRSQFELLQTLNSKHLQARPSEAALEARIRSFELAYRMQVEATDAFNIEEEPKHIVEMYGEGPQNRQLLMARRLAERGVRFVQTWHGNLQPWDSHSNIKASHRKVASECDQGLAALITDLKQRGMLDETLILCTGEFGRTPSVEMSQNGGAAVQGRDHNHWGYSLWLAGGGIKGGTIYGATDDFGFRAVENRTTAHDIHATMLHLLGFDHEKLTYRYAGRDFRLTDVHGHVVNEIIA
ncbi:MAG: sulfatase [Planctomycetaceae bacterium]|nr:sulfatase [Planctomycetaceae bacterium]